MSGEPDFKNHYVDVDGRTYRVALHRSGRPLIVVRRGIWAGKQHDTGQPLLIEGKTGRRAVIEALKQRAAETAGG